MKQAQRNCIYVLRPECRALLPQILLNKASGFRRLSGEQSKQKQKEKKYCQWVQFCTHTHVNISSKHLQENNLKIINMV